MGEAYQGHIGRKASVPDTTMSSPLTLLAEKEKPICSLFSRLAMYYFDKVSVPQAWSFSSFS